MLWWSVSQYLLKQQWILDQARARDVQEAPQVQLPAKGRLEAALQEVLHPPVLLLLVQQRLGCQLVAAVVLVGVEPRKLQGRRELVKLLFFFFHWKPRRLLPESKEVEGRGRDTYPVHYNLSDLAHSPNWPRGFGELRQEVLVQRDVGIQVAEDVSELLF